MIKKTDLDACKKQAKILFQAVPIEPIQGLPFMCNHPFTNSLVYYSKENATLVKMDNQMTKLQYQSDVFELIDTRHNIGALFALIRNNYYLTFLKFCKPYLTDTDFADMLKLSWTCEENPNDDANVSLRTVLSWFRHTDKKSLMSEDELRFYNDLPQKFTAYRGVSVGRKPYGASFTLDRDKAIWFANRFGKDGIQLAEVEISKENIFAYFNCRNESEIVVDVFNKAVRPCITFNNLS